MGSAPSTENKEEHASTAAENKNEVIYDQKGMQVINLHGETILISLAATTITILFLLALYKWMERRGCWKRTTWKSTATPAPLCPECRTTNFPMAEMQNLRVSAPSATSPRTIAMTTQSPPEKWSNSWYPSNWRPLATPVLPPKYSKEYKRKEVREAKKMEDPAPLPEKGLEEDEPERIGRHWDGTYVRDTSSE